MYMYAYLVMHKNYFLSKIFYNTDLIMKIVAILIVTG